MKLAAVALDYDGTIAVEGAMDPGVRDAIGQLRRQGIAVVLATGRRLSDLGRVAGDLECFTAIAAENGAVLYFPESQRQTVVGHVPAPRLIEGMRGLNIEFAIGESVVETDGIHAASVLRLVHTLELPVMLAFNRGRLMLLPPGISKSSGLGRVLSTLRLSIHNAIGIGDAENDHDLLDACEVGVAVEWGSAALRAVADDVIQGSGPPAIAPYLRGLARQQRLPASLLGRHRLLLGHEHNGRPVQMAIRGRTVIIAGEPGSGKSWLAGLQCEQLILRGYSLCIFDPDGDYLSLETLPGVLVMGRSGPPPRARDLREVLRIPPVSIVIDLSRLSHHEIDRYLHEILPALADMRRQSGLPHTILLDEAHDYLIAPEGRRLIDADLSGYILVTYRISGIDEEVRSDEDLVLIATHETDELEQQTLREMCESAGIVVPEGLFDDLGPCEAVLLAGAQESHGRVQRFQIGPYQPSKLGRPQLAPSR